MTPKPEIILDADVYDTLELADLVFGGIGFGSDYYVGRGLEKIPCCPHGIVAEYDDNGFGNGDGNEILFIAGITRGKSDSVVGEIADRLYQYYFATNRVPFSEWCKELNIVRGPSPEPSLWAGMPS